MGVITPFEFKIGVMHTFNRSTLFGARSTQVQLNLEKVREANDRAGRAWQSVAMATNPKRPFNHGFWPTFFSGSIESDLGTW